MLEVKYKEEGTDRNDNEWFEDLYGLYTDKGAFNILSFRVNNVIYTEWQSDFVDICEKHLVWEILNK